MTRLQKFRNSLEEQGVDAALIIDELNIHSLSDFSFTDGLLLITKYKAYIITDFRYYEMALKFADKEFEVAMPDNKVKFIADALHECGVRTLGFEGASVSYQVYSSYSEKVDTFLLSETLNGENLVFVFKVVNAINGKTLFLTSS